VRAILHVLAMLGAVNAAIGLCLGLLQQFHPALDSFSHFRLHFVAVLVLCCLILMITSSGKGRVFALIPVIAGTVWLGVQIYSGPPRDGPRGDLRLVQFNLNFRNPAMEEVGAMLSALEADVVALQEVPPQHEAVLRALRAYRYQAHCKFRTYVGGVSILSKHPISSTDCVEKQGLVISKIVTPTGEVSVASIHTYWPWPYSQHEQIDRWLPSLSQTTGPMVIAGDFNAAAWSHAVERIEDASRTRVVPGLRMTIGLKLFPFLPALPIPIDHVLISPDLCAASARALPTVWSFNAMWRVAISMKR